MKELHELPTRQKEIDEISSGVESEIFSSNLTRQEADDKVAVLIEERRTVEESEKSSSYVDIGKGTIEELTYRKRLVDKALDNFNFVHKELQALKSKRSYEKDAAKKSYWDKKISDKQDEFNKAKLDYENKKNSYESYARTL